MHSLVTALLLLLLLAHATASALPDTPDTPDTPKIPDTTNMQDAPDMPISPITPITPESADIPETPGELLCARLTDCVACSRPAGLQECQHAMETAFRSLQPEQPLPTCAGVLAVVRMERLARASLECAGFWELMVSRQAGLHRPASFVLLTAGMVRTLRIEVEAALHAPGEVDVRSLVMGALTLGNSHVPNAVDIHITSSKGKLREAVRMALKRVKRDQPWNQVWEDTHVDRVSMDGKEFVVTVHFSTRYWNEASSL